MVGERDEESTATKVRHQKPRLIAHVILGIPGLNNANEHAEAVEQCLFWVTNEILNNTSQHLSAASFLVRAGDLLSDVKVRIDWGSGDPSERALLDYEFDPELDGRFARALYLSQKFVEELCSADGMTDALLSAIERVIFEAHPEKDGTFRFDQLLDLRASRHRLAREREEEAIVSLRSDRA